jgi:hypothetical protein
MKRTLLSVLTITMLLGAALFAANTFPGDGPVGIGTASPATLLHLHTGTADTAKIRLSDASGSGTRGGEILGTWGSNGLIFSTLYNVSNDGGWLIFGNNTNTRTIIGRQSAIAINGQVEPWRLGVDGTAVFINGNVGIGTTAPSVKLDINQASDTVGVGNVGFRDGVSVWAQQRLTATQHDLAIDTFINGVGWFERMRIANGGNIGISTPTPSSALEVRGRIFSSTVIDPPIHSGTGISMVYRGNAGYNQGVGGYIFSYDAGPLAYKPLTIDAATINMAIGGTTKMTINNAGNVGIGLTNPTYILSIYNPNTANLVSVRTNVAHMPAVINLINNNLSLAEEFGQIQFSSMSASFAALGGGWSDSTSHGFLAFHTSSDGGLTLPERMRVENNGYVGIGTTAPLAMLDVNGNFKSNGQFTGSSRTLKKDIEKLVASDYIQILDSVNKLDLVRFRYKTQPGTDPRTVGVIAEDSPVELLAADKKSVNTITYTSYALAAIKAQQKEIEGLKAEIAAMKKKIQ